MSSEPNRSSMTEAHSVPEPERHPATKMRRKPGEPLDQGSPPDWGAVLASHDRWLRRVVAARLGEPQAVDEVLQEVALAVVTSSGPSSRPLIPSASTSLSPPQSRSSSPSHLIGWLYRLAVRQVLQYRRRAGRQRALVGRYAARGGATDVDRGPGGVSGDDENPASPLGWMLLDERRRIVREALSRLPPRDADLLSLKYAEGWTAPEIAHRLGLAIAAVEARLHRARRKLRGELAALASEFERNDHDSA
jgi:RNA polymerase sigma-70 factor (ECF subfamily)